MPDPYLFLEPSVSMVEVSNEAIPPPNALWRSTAGGSKRFSSLYCSFVMIVSSIGKSGIKDAKAWPFSEERCSKPVLEVLK
ncbi:hypothetical protein FRX31_020791 [Thalictrum thalictroides]|uniref:Uncharacterized protein n=1 Tax=Thalictrum thalictroides TaxID=46969 RepID=A0A7J6VZ46_THATH|nr:hypothetical protein FRX31_020791 [Thalictrum thalictroides]